MQRKEDASKPLQEGANVTQPSMALQPDSPDPIEVLRDQGLRTPSDSVRANVAQRKKEDAKIPLVCRLP
jgi:hypothetical protein